MNDHDIHDRKTGSEPPRLLDLAREAIRRHHFSYRTEETYLQWMKRFILFSGKRHPREMGAAEVTAFLNDLATTRKVAAATQNQALQVGGRAADREGGRWKVESFQTSVITMSPL